ncbi:HNH endonuclease [Agrobacterium phage OLIVR2]|uniref:HNH endonuclease n=2 Tax=root TaxID=1 RepID=A0A858MU24_9CAUD|nr:HNH endonuclease [Agrobacterium phage OLIVR1]QIW87240.1 HNH endonuclease [Agrobacterium phage OLIVR1]QIW87348.1 HNH endonuclease [Agrobacterium phage OLIVR2]QIW87455.1 HNH endonuclease [Agrobacterium phage OLIVR3]
MHKRWNNRYANQRAFTAQDKKGYHVGAINDVQYRANRIIFKMLYGYDPIQVDHDNGVTNDDRVVNLIEVTHTGNQRNMKLSKANKSGVVGVSWNTEKDMWEATIGIKGKRVVIVRSPNKQVCIDARRQAEIDEGYHPSHGKR